MILSSNRIKEEIRHGLIYIDVENKRNFGPNSYDCRLGEWYYQANEYINTIRIDNPTEVKNFWGDPIQAKETIIIKPGTTILAHTEEFIGTLGNYIAIMHSRSSIARCGISVHCAAGFGDVGYTGRWTMEISNHTQTALEVPVGIRICQFSFEPVAGFIEQEYTGKYGGIRKWSPEDMLPKLWLDWEKAERTQE